MQPRWPVISRTAPGEIDTPKTINGLAHNQCTGKRKVVHLSRNQRKAGRQTIMTAVSPCCASNRKTFRCG